MRKIVLYIAMSLDGYIADEKNGVEWLGGDNSDPENMGSYEKFIDTIDTVILGHKTYHQIVTELSPDAWVYAGMQSYVMTHRKFENTDEICFTDENFTDLFSKIREKEGKDIWVCGGASIANELIDLNLIDRYHISVIPTILGGGIKLFNNHLKNTDLKLVSTENYNGIVDLVYDVRD